MTARDVLTTWLGANPQVSGWTDDPDAPETAMLAVLEDGMDGAGAYSLAAVPPESFPPPPAGVFCNAIVGSRGLWLWAFPTDGERDAFLSSCVPQSVSMRQARLALNAAGLLAGIDAAVSGADAETQINWEYASAVERSNPIVAAIAQGAGLTSGQVDDLFRAAILL